MSGDISWALQRHRVLCIRKAARAWFPEDVHTRLQTVARVSLLAHRFETHLSDKVQFLLDAVLGFINTEQNEIFKVLTHRVGGVGIS